MSNNVRYILEYLLSSRVCISSIGCYPPLGLVKHKIGGPLRLLRDLASRGRSHENFRLRFPHSSTRTSITHTHTRITNFQSPDLFHKPLISTNYIYPSIVIMTEEETSVQASQEQETKPATYNSPRTP
jgi:hypothetical protein